MGRDRNGFARRVDRALPAARAHRDGDLVIGSTRIFGSAENASSHREQERVVVEDLAGFSPEPVGGFAKQGEGFGADIQVQGVLLGVGIFAIAGFGAAWEAAHHTFDFADRAVMRSGEPLAFSLRCGNAGELAHCGPAEAAGFEGLGECRQGLQGPGHAKAFFGGSGSVAQHALGVFAEAGDPEQSVRLRSVSDHQPVRFVPVELGSLASDA